MSSPNSLSWCLYTCWVLTDDVQRSERGCEILWQLCFQQEKECAGAGDPPGLHVLWNTEICGEQQNCIVCRTDAHYPATMKRFIMFTLGRPPTGYAVLHDLTLSSSSWFLCRAQSKDWFDLSVQGPIKVTVQELDGSFNHTLQIEENSLKHDIPCHSKSRRSATLKHAYLSFIYLELFQH